MRHKNIRIGDQHLSAAVSGSFHRHMDVITAAVQELASLSIRVLSPSDPRVVANRGEFLFVASDRIRSVRLVQDRHFECIRAADFLWLVCPDGYVGQSGSMEVGFAAALGIPIFSIHAPSDLTLRQYVSTVPTVAEALRMVAGNARPISQSSMLIDPHASAEEAHRILERLEAVLTRSSGVDEPARDVCREMSDLRAALRVPTYTQ